MTRYDVVVTWAVGECGEATSHRVRARCPEAAYESVRRAAAGDWQDVVPTTVRRRRLDTHGSLVGERHLPG